MEGGELLLNGDRVSVWEEERLMEKDDGDGRTIIVN